MDGIRVQAVNEGGERRLYSRTGDDIGKSFPDVLAALNEGALDGELLVLRDGHIGGFDELQQRLNRKTAPAAPIAQYPGPAFAPMICCWMARRYPPPVFYRTQEAPEAFVARLQSAHIDLSPLQAFTGWKICETCAPIRPRAMRSAPKA